MMKVYLEIDGCSRRRQLTQPSKDHSSQTSNRLFWCSYTSMNFLWRRWAHLTYLFQSFFRVSASRKSERGISPYPPSYAFLPLFIYFLIYPSSLSASIVNLLTTRLFLHPKYECPWASKISKYRTLYRTL
jgi:hypothetical protein